MSSHVEQLNKLWQETAKNRVFSWKNLLTNIKVLIKYKTTLISADYIKVIEKELLLPDCERCTNNCCSGAENSVSLRLIDIARLLDAGLADAIQLDKQPLLESNYYQAHPEQAKLLNRDDWRWFPILKRAGEQCAFLENNRCTIHAHRPLTCRRFPYMFSPEPPQAKFSPRCQSRQITLDKQAYQKYLKELSDSYNEKIKDLLMVNYAYADLEEIGLTKYLSIK